MPYVNTPMEIVERMLRMAEVRKGDYVVDLGSGDGRIVIEAAKRGARGLGVDLDPNLVRLATKNAQQAGVGGEARFEVRDIFETDLAPASVVTMYLLPEFNLRLRPSLLALKPGTRIVSHDWDMGDWQPDATTVVPVPDKEVGIEKSSSVHLWIVPAKVEGLWCGAAGPLALRQAYQVVSGTAGTRPVRGRVEGADVVLEDARFTLAGDTLRGTAASYTRARGGVC